ncbi:hypothetical protein [Stenotrophomonas nitritireducens]|uniref:hypothetical protein n=1 Tax=Stenotrophomonas nitritireducens TaxID=83617 RepID=UPI003D99D76D
MPFEIVFITEGRDDSPAAEVQFNGQRLCIVRLLASDAPQIEFLTDLYVGRDVKMVFPYSQFQEQIQLATSELTSWQREIASGRAEA